MIIGFVFRIFISEFSVFLGSSNCIKDSKSLQLLKAVLLSSKVFNFIDL
jgi:hypothetical protein